MANVAVLAAARQTFDCSRDTKAAAYDTFTRHPNRGRGLRHGRPRRCRPGPHATDGTEDERGEDECGALKGRRSMRDDWSAFANALATQA